MLPVRVLVGEADKAVVVRPVIELALAHDQLPRLCIRVPFQKLCLRFCIGVSRVALAIEEPQRVQGFPRGRGAPDMRERGRILTVRGLVSEFICAEGSAARFAFYFLQQPVFRYFHSALVGNHRVRARGRILESDRCAVISDRSYIVAVERKRVCISDGISPQVGKTGYGNKYNKYLLLDKQNND